MVRSNLHEFRYPVEFESHNSLFNRIRVKKVMRLDDTIAAIATATGPAGIGVVRVSGKRALPVACSIFSPAHSAQKLEEAESHRLYHGWIHDQGRSLDEALVAVMRAPNSYTTEDVVEFQCHGGVAVLRAVLELILKQDVRLAEPGEFTQRAFLHGRLDLTRVEAVSDLIHARSRLGIFTAVNQLKGKLYEAIAAIQDQVAQVATLIEATIDFSDEDEEFTQQEECVTRLEQAREELEALLSFAEQGKILRSGLGVALIGRPNVGKSSLLNALLRENRAIVTEIPGTTRDVIEESIHFKGLAIRLIDTAGIRLTKDVVESEGVLRSKNAWETADMALLLLDCSSPLNAEDQQLLEQADPQKTIVVLNKKDLLPGDKPAWLDQCDAFKTVLVSAKEADGLQELEESLFEKSTRDEFVMEEQALITNIRQQQSARKALSALQVALEGLRHGVGEECLAVDLAGCLRALGEIVGETTADDLLNRIFSQFCIGK